MRSLIHSTTRSGHSSAQGAQPGARNGMGAGHPIIGLSLGVLAALAVFGLAEGIHAVGGNPFERAMPDGPGWSGSAPNLASEFRPYGDHPYRRGEQP